MTHIVYHIRSGITNIAGHLHRHKNIKVMAVYIQNKLKEDDAADQPMMEEYDPFTGSK